MNRSRFALAGVLALAGVGLLGLSGCPITTTCRAGDITSRGCTCLPNDVRPECRPTPTTGAIALTWTVNGQAANVGCGPANAATVRFTIGATPAVVSPCTDGSRVFPGLNPGPYTVLAELLDGANTVLAQFNQSVTVQANLTANLSIPFTVGGAGTGSIAFTWTVNHQPAATACPAGAQVTLETTQAPAAPPSPLTVPCTQGTATFNGLPVGPYTWKATLSATPPVIVADIAVTVVANQTANVPAINFATGGTSGGVGSATISWTINGGQNCPVDAGGQPIGTLAITARGGPTAANGSAACNTFTLQVPNLAEGTYTFDLVLTSPAHPGVQAQAQATGIQIMANQDAAVGPIDLVCTFCPNAPAGP